MASASDTERYLDSLLEKCTRDVDVPTLIKAVALVRVGTLIGFGEMLRRVRARAWVTTEPPRLRHGSMCDYFEGGPDSPQDEVRWTVDNLADLEAALQTK